MCLADGGIRITDASAGYGAELSPQLLRGLNQRLAADPGNAQQLRLRAQVYAGMADWDNAQADSRRWLNARSDKSLPWFIAGNWGAGPFPPDLDGQYAPEGPFDPARPLIGPEGQLNWRLLPEDPNGYIDLGILVSELGDNSAYVVSSIYSEQSQQVTLTIACDDPIRIWLNSKVAYELKTPQSAPHDPARVPVTLEAGWNTLLSRIVHVSRNDASGPPKVALEPARRAP